MSAKLSVRAALRHACSSGTRALEALADGEYDFVADLVADLVYEGARALDDEPIERCPKCPATYRWPEELLAHVERMHADEIVDNDERNRR